MPKPSIDYQTLLSTVQNNLSQVYNTIKDPACREKLQDAAEVVLCIKAHLTDDLESLHPKSAPCQ